MVASGGNVWYRQHSLRQLYNSDWYAGTHTQSWLFAVDWLCPSCSSMFVSQDIASAASVLVLHVLQTLRQEDGC